MPGPSDLAQWVTRYGIERSKLSMVEALLPTEARFDEPEAVELVRVWGFLGEEVEEQ
jgi:hypothetical protein